MKIVVINGGFVMVCRGFTLSDHGATLTEARTIRLWGTSEGLGQLVHGPTKETVLDAMVPVVSVPLHQIVFTFDVSSVWGKHL
jgi:hypothetical protein